MTTANQVYNIAKSHLGHSGSHARSYCGMSGGPYCCAFVTMCVQKAGGAKLFYGGKKCTYCPAAIKWCQANLAQIPPYLAMRMDFIFFDWQPNGTPDHIGFVLDKISTNKIKTLEGNTSGGIVAVKTRGGYIQGIFRPHYSPEKMPTKAKLAVDGDLGYKSIYMLQVALGVKADAILGKQTVKALQRKVGASPDGAWGPKTSRLIQSKLLGFTGKAVDGDFGPASVRAFQTWTNNKVFPSVSGSTTTAPKPATTTNAQKIVNKVNELAWPYGTASSKWDYKKGSPTAKCKAAMKAFGYTSKSKMSSCIYAVNTVVRSTGINKSFCAGHGYKKPYPKTEAGFNTVLSGKAVPSGFLQPGDIVRYKKTTRDEHTLIYMGNGRIAEARHYHRFFNIYKDEKRYNGSNVKKSTLQVLRAK